MGNSTARAALRLAFVVAGLLCSASSHAIVAVIDQFSVDKNGSNIFTDTFANNLTPTQEPATYNVQGTFPNGAEAGGLLTLDSDWGVLSSNALGQPRQNLHATWRSNIDPANSTAGLNINSTIGVTGIFDLVTPTGPLNNGYGIRVIDAVQGQSSTDLLVELNVQFWEPAGGDVVRFLLQDFANNTITTLGFVPFAPGTATQIELMISRPDTNNTDFYGAYAFGTGGTFGAVTTFGTPGALFTGTDFVRAQFHAFTAVPEPGTLALFGLAFAGLVASRQRRHPIRLGGAVAT